MGRRPASSALPPPRHDEVVRVLASTARRIERLLASRAEEDEQEFARDEPLLAALAAASLHTRIAGGPEQGERWRRVGDRVEPSDPHGDPDATPHVPECRGMSLHAGRERPCTRPAPTGATLSLCRATTAGERPARGAPGWPAPASPEDALARRHHAHRDGAKRTDRPSRALDSAAASAPGAGSRDPRAVCEPAQPGRAGSGV